MRKLGFVLLSMLLVAEYSYATNVTVPTKIKDVTIYLSGASLSCVADAKIPAGVSTVTLTDLPTAISEESIQLEGVGDFVINNVLYRVTLDKTPKGDSLTKIKQELEDKIAVLKYTKDVYANEIEILNANREIKGANSNLSTVELDKVLKFYQSEMLKLKENIRKTDKSIAELNTELSRINSELAPYRNRTKGEVEVTVSSTKAQNIKLGMSYYVNCAYWTPFYEARVEDVNKDISVAYKAKIYQSSGYDWDNVKVTLSTGNPTLNGTVPTLNKWILREHQPQVRYSKANLKMAAAESVAYDMEMDEAAAASKSAMSNVARGIRTTTDEKMTTIEFVIDELFSVKSQQNDAMLTINTNNLPAEYVYRCVPKLDRNAYLLAKITDFAKYNFLSGDVTLYLGGKYVGTSYLNIAQTTDTLKLSLGQDKGIMVERTLSDEFNKKSTIGKNYKQTAMWNISVRNNKSTNVKIEILDNLPVSGSSSITVSNMSYDGATLDDKNIATWNLDLKPSETKNLKLSYTVTYPKTMSLNLK
ncbi:MAG: mucoidy inhibitor MuiA family protein [Bacteroidales bacterium]|nr:mucoidy inhibitor MuiA family protein [Bacteroidales bacterium]